MGRGLLIGYGRIVSGGIGIFGSFIVKLFGYIKFEVILFNILFGVI